MSDWKKRFDEAWKKNMPIRWFVPGIGALLIVLLHYTGASRSAESEPKVLYMLVWGLAGAVFFIIGIIRLIVGMFKAKTEPEKAPESVTEEPNEQ
ncbi:MAG: hypothetical protein E7463_04555 [Ruminococcaceae bacterium]|nr:hypothetical protein [Oscillospiraceae bacterium]